MWAKRKHCQPLNAPGWPAKQTGSIQEKKDQLHEEERKGV